MSRKRTRTLQFFLDARILNDFFPFIMLTCFPTPPKFSTLNMCNSYPKNNKNVRNFLIIQGKYSGFNLKDKSLHGML